MFMGLGRVALAAVLVVCGLALPAAAQDYPSKPVELVVPWDAGSDADQTARKIASLMEAKLKVSVINVPGESGQTGLARLLSSPADGYSLAVLGADTVALQAGSAAPKWTVSELVPLGIVYQQPFAFVTAEGGKFSSWADVEKAARIDAVRVATRGMGGADDIIVNYYARKGLKLTAVPLAKPEERSSAVLGGQAELACEAIGAVRSLVDGKHLRPLLLFAEKRDATFKDLPTAVELGDKATPQQFISLVVRAGTDPRIVRTLADALTAAAKDPAYVKLLQDQNADPESFIGVTRARVFLDGQLASLKALAAPAGATKAEAPTAPAETKKN
jgi:tripartite-type tricarboxylate transporter receptor subunit TctC